MQSARAVARVRHFSTTAKWSREKAPVILSAVRTPIGSFNGVLSSLQGHQLGSIAVKAAVERSKVEPREIQQAILGNVISAGQGQAPARQAVIGAGLPWNVSVTAVNKVCSSGMKATTLGAAEILIGQCDVVVTGGFESMSNIPYYLPKARRGLQYGHGEIHDGILRDGLWDAFTDQHMGSCAEHCAKKYAVTRADVDKHALESYRRAQESTKNGLFEPEIIRVEIADKRGKNATVSVDEEPNNLKADKVPTLKPAFQKDGIVTAANSSKINDGAAALVLSSAAFAAGRGAKPLGRIIGYADAEHHSTEFPTAPALAIPLAIKNAGLSPSDISFYEINEAFSVVAVANAKILGIDLDKINVFGGAVAMGHPIGCSGARIIVTLLNVLKQKNAQYGVAAICNGGGGASAVVVERLE